MFCKYFMHDEVVLDLGPSTQSTYLVDQSWCHHPPGRCGSLSQVLVVRRLVGLEEAVEGVEGRGDATPARSGQWRRLGAMDLMQL